MHRSTATSAMRKVFKLYYLHGKSYSEIAKELNKSEGTIRNQKKQALRLLRNKFSPVFRTGTPN